MPEEQGQIYAKEKGIIFKLTSAFNGNGVEELFKELFLQFLEQNEEKDDNNNSIMFDKKVNAKKHNPKCCG